MCNSFSVVVVYNRTGAFIFYKSSRSCFRGSIQSRSNVSIPLSLLNMVSLIQHQTLNSFSTKTRISKSLTSSASTFRSFWTTVEICNTMQYYQWKTLVCLFECLDLNCVSMFRDLDTILLIFTHVFLYNLVAKWQLKLTYVVILVKHLLEKESHNQI